jgi:hypothetical protein
MMRRPIALVVALLCTTALAACSGTSAGKPAPTPSGATPSVSPSGPPPTYTKPPATLPAVRIPLVTTPPPWLPPLETHTQQSADYVAAAGLPYYVEMLKVHYHAHLDITINGQAVAVPPYLGFVAKGQHLVGLAPLHTHLADGIIHIENNVPATFVLGQFFVEWGVRFTPTCLGPYCTGHGKELAVFVNGKRLTTDPTRLVLASHQEIAIEYGAKGQLPTPPSTYQFPSGY